MKKMGFCDFGHETRDVRRLPIGGGANVWVCKTHFKQEMEMRKANQFDQRGKSLKMWNRLEKQR